MEFADRLIESAANALLKAIEEPGNRTVWLLCAPILHDVLPTIRSRCCHMQLVIPSTEAVAQVLQNKDAIPQPWQILSHEFHKATSVALAT